MISFIIPVLFFATGILAPPQMKVVDAYKAREIRKSDVSINSAPLTLKSLRGKVVVIDFWAFDCEPCIEAMPHIQQLYQKYGPEGLVVIGVHTPRAEYEKDVTKLGDAITKMRIKFPLWSRTSKRFFVTTFAIFGHRNSWSMAMELYAIATVASADTATWNKLSSNY